MRHGQRHYLRCLKYVRQLALSVVLPIMTIHYHYEAIFPKTPNNKDAGFRAGRAAVTDPGAGSIAFPASSSVSGSVPYPSQQALEGRMVPAPRRGPAAEDWVAVKALAVLAGDSVRVAAQITAEVDAAGLTEGQRSGADTCVRYLTSKQELRRYNQALAAGWPIATGVIEGACRHLIGDRLDITGARWD